MTSSAPLIAPITWNDVDDAHTLAGEHAQLMRDVARRAAPVRTLLDAHAWPHDELGTLTAFLRTAVLRQASDEEVHLFPHDASAPPFAELSADHVRLHALTAQVERVRDEPCSPPQLRALIDELVTVLRRHLEDEQAVFAALAAADAEVPSVADLSAASHGSPLHDDTPVLIELESLPAEHAIEWCIERLLRLQPGQTSELHARDDRLLRGISRWLHDFDPVHYGFSQVRTGRGHLLQVTRRPSGEAPEIGYPG